MKTLNFGLSKILNDLGLLDNIETEWKIQLLPTKIGNKWNKGRLVKNWNGKGRIYKTLTLEEVIEFLNINLLFKKENSYHSKFYNLTIIGCGKDGYVVGYQYELEILKEFDGKTVLEAIEKMLEYLLDNNLLFKLK